MRTFLFCFANQNYSAHPLATLQEEYEAIDRLLDARSHLQHFLKVPVPFASTTDIVQKLQTYRDSLAIFHFSGHAGHTVLQLDDTLAGAKGIARLLGRCPNLKLIFLNGCSTLGHIQQLTDQGIQAAIIATCAPVNDRLATQFSTAFYQALEKQCSLQEALEEARFSIIEARADHLKMTTLYRSAVDLDAELSGDQWYFFCPNPELAHWKLPTTVELSSYSPNVLLRQKLFEALGDQDSSFYDAYESVQSRYTDEGLLDWTHKQILERLPYPLAEPLRRLFRREFVAAESRWLPVALSKERLQNYLMLVDNSLHLVISTYLAQVRDRLLQAQKPPETDVESETLLFLQNLLTQGWRKQSPEELVMTFQTLQKRLAIWKIPLFAEGMSSLATELDQSSPLYDSLLFFQELRHQISSPAGVPNVEYYCEAGENHLLLLLEKSGFWVHFRLESIRNIRVINYFDLPGSQYFHEKVVLRSNLSEDPSEKVFIENEQDVAWNCQSVLLVDRENRYLNLSPFVIDRNVYKKSNSTFDLFSFANFQHGKLVFTRLTFPDHPPLEVFLTGPGMNPQEDFTVLRRQVKTLHSLVKLDLPSSPPVRTKPILRI